MNPLNHLHPSASLADFMPNVLLLAQSLTDAPGQPVVAQADPASWTLSMLMPIVLGAVGYLLIQHGIVKSRAFIGAGVVALLLAAGVAIGFTPGTFESYMLMGFCALATGGGIGFLVAREPVYAALGFATAVLSVCGVLFMQSALFIAAATMIVYAGATIIIFLFVLMFAQQTELRNYDVQLSNPLVAATIGAILLATITMCVTGENAILPLRHDATRSLSAADLPDNLRTEAGKEAVKRLDAIDPGLQFVPGTTAGLGRSLYTDYLIAVELAGTVLLVATIGAIALAQRSTETQS
jgi:NADH-quinone oxidoreductase subunit J